MALAPGTRLGPYEVIAPIGTGGMGEVYRARDNKLGREVAVKVLPPELSDDPVALARFQREAQAVAALSHPHILTIYDFGASDGITYAVTELLTGETLRQRLDRGSVPQKRALEIAGRIALGLAAAHEKGIVHRDLKPENLFLTKDGAVKILDFGIAKLVRPMQPRSPETVTDQTAAGSLLGTLGYMSPEQVRGEPVDHRSDIFSLGAVLYEMLAGRRAFEGETPVETLHAILKKEPQPLAETGQSRSPSVERIVAHCLEKSRSDRFQSARDLAFALGAIFDPTPSGIAASQHLPWRRMALGLSLFAAGAIAAFLAFRTRTAPPFSLHATLPPPDGARIVSSFEFPSLAISPDGRTVAFAAQQNGVDRLYLRRLAGAASEPIPGTEDGYGPFFSPDGQWIAFFGQGELKKVPLIGGAAISLTHVPPSNFGATWGVDGRIVYSRAPNGELWWVSQEGGDPKPLTRLDPGRGEQAHLFPQFVAGRRDLLFTVRHGRDFQEVGKSSIAVLDAATGKHRIVLEGVPFARYGAGRLVFLRGDAVFSVPFDAARLETAGPVATFGEAIAVHQDEGFADFDVSSDGTLVFLDGPPRMPDTSMVVRLDRAGKESTIALPLGRYLSPRLSPDGRRLALVRRVGGREEVDVYDRDREVLTALTPEPGRYFSPIWSPDGSYIAFARFHVGSPALCLKRSDGAGEILSLTAPSEEPEFANSWSPDGATIAYTVLHAMTSERDAVRGAFSSDIWLAGADGRRATRPWFETAFHETAATFSPDGKWIAYVSDESGMNEVFLGSYPGAENRIKVSSRSGIEPIWSREGRELIYRAGPNADQFMAVDVVTVPSLTVSPPRLLFTSDLASSARFDIFRQYDVSRDGNEFFALREISAPEPERRLVVVTEWASTQPR